MSASPLATYRSAPASPLEPESECASASSSSKREDKSHLLLLFSKLFSRYVCEYIYRCSLRRNAARTLFVHVPEVVEGGLSAEEIARGLQVVIEAVLQELQVPNFIE